MSKRPFDTLQPKITRNDRFAQMSHQEKIIEQKKREIQAKLEAKQKIEPDIIEKEKSEDSSKSENSDNEKADDTKLAKFNTFSNDGSFLNQFKQLKEKKSEPKVKPFNFKEKNSEKSKWNNKKRSPSPHGRHRRQSRFSSEKVPNFEQKITINPSFSISTPPQSQPITLSVPIGATPPPPIPTQPVPSPVPQQVQQFENIQPPPQPQLNIVQSMVPVAFSAQSQVPSVLQLSVPPPQLPLVQNMLVPAPLQQVSAVLTTVALPPPILTGGAVQVPPPCLPQVELGSIPPPNPIQVQNIPAPEPLNTINIPPPAPLQVHAIPTPRGLQLNEIPNPKPLDIMAIPTPTDDSKNMSNPEFIKNIPPPNKSVPPPNMEVQMPLARPPQPSNILLSNPGFRLVNPPTSQIPSLMATTILPPPGMTVNVSCPPPSFVSPPPMSTSQMPPMNVPPPMVPGGPGMVAPAQFKDMNAVFPAGTASFEAMSSLARMVADCGPRIEDVVRQKKTQDPSLWFLFHKESAAYRQYVSLIDEYRREKEMEEDGRVKPEDVYEPEMALEDDVHVKNERDERNESYEKKRKRKSRWGEKDMTVPPPTVALSNIPQSSNQQTPLLSKVTRNDPGLIQYAINAYGSANLSDEDWKKAEDNYKIHLLYQDMMRKREQVQKLQNQGKNKYEYDSDEDTEGGTWEHKLREKEMTATELWAQELNKQAEGKHHIGDFLPPDELKRFMEKSNAVKEGRMPNFSDYKEFKIKEDNIGFQMLQKLGWTEGQGLGSQGTGIVEPVNKGAPREHTQGLGLNLGEANEDEDEYESYRKRMMLAYRFRPNPLNNPRRPYY